MNLSDLQLIGDEFGVHRLQIADSVGTFPVDGVIYGSSNRIFVPLTIQKRKISIVVIFFYLKLDLQVLICVRTL